LNTEIIKQLSLCGMIKDCHQYDSACFVWMHIAAAAMKM